MKLITRQAGVEQEVEVVRHEGGYRVRIGDRWVEADCATVGSYVRSLRMSDGTQFSFVFHREGHTWEIAIGGGTVYVDVIDPLAAKRQQRADEGGGGGTIKALMPGRIVRVLVTPGDPVRKGAGLLILEAMKMENEIQAPVDGIVDDIFVEAGRTVEAGADLVHIGPSSR